MTETSAPAEGDSDIKRLAEEVKRLREELERRPVFPAPLPYMVPVAPVLPVYPQPWWIGPVCTTTGGPAPTTWTTNSATAPPA